MLRFYLALLLATPRLFIEALRTVEEWIAIVLFTILVAHKPLGEKWMNWWEGVHPAWALIPLGLLFVHLWMREAYQMLERERDRCNGVLAECTRLQQDVELHRSQHESKPATLADVRDFIRKRLDEGRPILDENRHAEFIPWIDRCRRFAELALIASHAEQFRKATEANATDKKRFGRGMSVLGKWYDALTEKDVKSTCTLSQLTSDTH